MNNNLSDKLKSFMKLYAIYAVIAMMCLVYTLIGTVNIQEREDASFGVIVENMLLPYIFGICISSLFREQGLMIGAGEESVKKAEAAHDAASEACLCDVERLDKWCAQMTDHQLKLMRMRVLADAGLKYADYFDEEGQLYNYYAPPRSGGRHRAEKTRKAAHRKKMRAFKKAVNMKITPMTAGLLLDEGYNASDPYKIGRSREQFRSQKFAKGLITKPLTAFVLGYYTFSQIENFDPAVMLGQIFGMITFIAFGVISMVGAISYMKEEYAGRLTRTTGYMRQFMNEMDAQKKQEEEEDNSDGRESNTQRLRGSAA